jgi:hypothetical protein
MKTFMQTVLNGKLLGTFESERRKALERILENVNVTFTVRPRSHFKIERINVSQVSVERLKTTFNFPCLCFITRCNFRKSPIERKNPLTVLLHE